MSNLNTTDKQLRDDLAHAASLARQGANAPLMGGRYGLFWGVLLSITFLAHWFIGSGAAGIDRSFVGAAWLTYGVIAAIGSIILNKSLPSVETASTSNKVESAVWGYFGLALAALFIGIALRIVLGVSGPEQFDLMLPFAFAGYAMAHLTTAKISNSSHLRWAGYVAVLGAIATIISYGKIEIYLIAAVFIVPSIIIPSWISLMNERRNA